MREFKSFVALLAGALLATAGMAYAFTVEFTADGGAYDAAAGDLSVPDNYNINAANPFLAGDSWTYTKDSTVPIVSTANPAKAASVSSLPSVVVTFSQPVTGVNKANLTVNGSAATALTGRGVGPYTFTGYAVPTDGTVNIVLTAGTIRNAAGTPFAGDSWAYTVSGPPTVLSVNPAKNSALSSVSSCVPPSTCNANVDVTFSEPVVGVVAGNFTVNGSAATAVSGSGAGPYTFTGFAVPADGTVNVVLAAGAITDSTSHPFAGDSWTYTKTVNPVVIDYYPARNSTRLTDFPFVSVEFSKEVTGMQASDLTVNGSPATDVEYWGFVLGEWYDIWVFTGYDYPPDGPVNVVLNAGSIVDADTGSRHFAGDSWTFTLDTPGPILETVTPGRCARVSSLPSVSVTFMVDDGSGTDKPVTGVKASDLTVNGSPATAVTGAGAGPYVFTGFAAPADGSVSVVLDGGDIVDSALNPFPGDSWTYMQTQAGGGPLVQTVAPARCATIPSLNSVRVTFSKPVTGVASGNLTVNDSAATAVTGSGAGPYEFTGYAVPADGPVIVALAPGSITDYTGWPTETGDHTWHIRNKADTTDQVLWLAGPLAVGKEFAFGGLYTADAPQPRKPITAYILEGANITMDVKVNNNLHGYIWIGEAYDTIVYQSGGTMQARRKFEVPKYKSTSPQHGIGRLEIGGGWAGTNRGYFNIGCEGLNGTVILTGGTLESSHSFGDVNQDNGSLFLGYDYFRIGSSVGELRALGGTLNVSRVMHMGRSGQYGDGTDNPWGTLDPSVTNPYYDPEAKFVLSQHATFICDLFVMWQNNTSLELILDSDADFNHTPTLLYAPSGWNNPGSLNRFKGDLKVTLADGYEPSYHNQEWKVMTSKYDYDISFVTMTPNYEFVVRDGTYLGVPVKELYLVYTGGVPCPVPFADGDRDGDVDQNDFALFQACYAGDTPGISGTHCRCFDQDHDNNVDRDDFDLFELCATGPGVLWQSSPGCP